MDIAIMVEGQDGLTWPRWHGIVQAVERLRFAGLYRSDHFTNGGPPILVGGNGTRRTLPLAARYATEWNATFQTPENFDRLNRRLDDLLSARGQSPSSVRRSMMTGLVFGRDDAAVHRRLAQRGRSREESRNRGVLVGTPAQLTDQLNALQGAGLQRVMLQWLDLDDLDGLEAFAEMVAKPFRRTKAPSRRRAGAE